MLTLISPAMYYTGSLSWMEVFKIFVEAKKDTPKSKNFCANIFHHVTFWALNQLLTFYDAFFWVFHSYGLPSN